MKVNLYISTVFFAFLLLATGCHTPAHTPSAYPEEEKETYIDFDKETISGTVEITAKQIALMVGGGWGSGVLNFQGKDYPFKIKGLKVGGVGYVKVDAVGKVYFLNKLEDFAGKYGAGAVGATAYKGGVVGTLENNKGVILQLKAKTTGLALSVGLGGISIKFEE